MKSSRPLVSIIVPVYKVEKYLKECVDSIIAQSLKDIEIILVDDGSPDNCGVLCDEYASNYPDIIKVIHKANGGLSSARNAGLDNATGQYIGFVDSDDAILPEMYEELVCLAKENNAELIISEFLDWNTKTKKTSATCGAVTPHDVLRDVFDWKQTPSACNKLFKRELIQNHRFYVGRNNEDILFLSELLLKNDIKIFVTDKGYYRYRVTPGSITKNLDALLGDFFKNVESIRKYLQESSPSKQLLNSFKRYELSIHIYSGMRINMLKQKKEFRELLRANRRYIRSHWSRLLFDPKITLRWRIKAAYAMFR